MKKLISSGDGPALSTGEGKSPDVPKAVVALSAGRDLENIGLLTKRLTPAEQSELSIHERVIERGVATFLEVGRALLDIKERGLYRERFKTFEEYCQKRWQMSARHAYRMCDAAQVVQNLLPPANATNWSDPDDPPFPAELPRTESQARGLKGLEPQEQRQVWKEAVKSVSPGDEVTAADVERAREKLHPKPKAPDEDRIVLIEMARVDLKGDICEANCHDLLGESLRSGLVPELKRVFFFEEDLWVTSLGHFGGSPGNWVRTQDCHRLIPDNSLYDGPKDFKFFAEGRTVLWKGFRYRLGPKVVFEGTTTGESSELQLEGEQASTTMVQLEREPTSSIILLRLDQALKAVSAFLHEVKNAKRSKQQIDCVLSAMGSLQYFQKFYLQAPAKKSVKTVNKTKTVLVSPLLPKPKADPFVLCRTDQSGRPTFRTSRGGWTTDPDKAVKFKSSGLAAAASNHDWDKPMSLSKARRKVQFKL